MFADWLKHTFNEPLQSLATPFYGLQWLSDDGEHRCGDVYTPKHPRCSLDGGAGLESMRRIAEAIGVHTTLVYRKTREAVYTVEVKPKDASWFFVEA